MKRFFEKWPSPIKSALVAMKFRFGIAGALLLVSTGIEVLLPLLQGKIVDLILKSFGKESLSRVVYWFLGAIVLKGVSDGVQAYVVQSIGQDFTHNLRTEMFRRMLHFPVTYFDKIASGRLVTRIITDLRSMGELFSASICVAGLDVVVILASVVIMVWLQPVLAMVLLLPVPFAFYLIHRYGEKVAVAFRIARSRLGTITGFLGENFGALTTIQRLAGEKAQSKKFSRLVQDHQDSQMNALRVFAMAQPIINATNGLTFSLLVIFGGLGVIDKRWSLGVLVAFLGYLKNLFQPLRDLIEKYNTILAARVAFERVFSIFTEKLESDLTIGKEISKTSEFSIEFEDVTFRYPEGKGLVLNQVSFTVAAGETVAIIGPTGGGKSTIFRLLLGFYRHSYGLIRIAGVDLSELNLESLRQKIGFVAQELFLFRGTVRENLTVGSEKWSEAQMLSSLETVGLWERIKERGGLGLFLEEGGENLSLGERQLLAMARVFLSNPPLLLFDEVTSQIDAKTESMILNALEILRRGRTCLFIAHRPKAAELADKVIEIREGKAYTKVQSSLVDKGKPLPVIPSLTT